MRRSFIRDIDKEIFQQTVNNASSIRHTCDLLWILIQVYQQLLQNNIDYKFYLESV